MIPVPWSPPDTKGFFLSLFPPLARSPREGEKEGATPTLERRRNGAAPFPPPPLSQLQEAAAAAAAAPRMGFWAEEGGGGRGGRSGLRMCASLLACEGRGRSGGASALFGDLADTGWLFRNRKGRGNIGFRQLG